MGKESKKEVRKKKKKKSQSRRGTTTSTDTVTKVYRGENQAVYKNGE